MADSEKINEYIIKIYPAEGMEPEGIVGVIECIDNAEKRVFITLTDLYKIIIDFESNGNSDFIEIYLHKLERTLK